MKYAVSMTSGDMIYISIVIKNGLGYQKLTEKEQIDICKEKNDFLKLLSFKK